MHVCGNSWIPAFSSLLALPVTHLIARCTNVWPESNADGLFSSATSLAVNCLVGSPPDERNSSTGLWSPCTTARHAFSHDQSAWCRCRIRLSYSQLLGGDIGRPLPLSSCCCRLALDLHTTENKISLHLIYVTSSIYSQKKYAVVYTNFSTVTAHFTIKFIMLLIK